MLCLPRLSGQLAYDGADRSDVVGMGIMLLAGFALVSVLFTSISGGLAHSMSAGWLAERPASLLIAQAYRGAHAQQR